MEEKLPVHLAKVHRRYDVLQRDNVFLGENRERVHQCKRLLLSRRHEWAQRNPVLLSPAIATEKFAIFNPGLTFSEKSKRH